MPQLRVIPSPGQSKGKSEGFLRTGRNSMDLMSAEEGGSPSVCEVIASMMSLI